MKNLVTLCLYAALAQAPLMAAANAGDDSAHATAGALLYSQDGHRLGTVYDLTHDGSVRLIYDGSLVVIPASTLTQTGGKLTTALSKNDVRGLKH